MVMVDASLIFLSVLMDCAVAHGLATNDAAALPVKKTDLIIAWALFDEKVVERGEGLELDGIPGGVQKKHGGLLTRLTFETNVGLDDKLRASGL